MAALGSQSGISKSQVIRICAEIDLQVQAFLKRPLEGQGYAYLYLDATYLHGRLRRAMQDCSRARADSKCQPGFSRGCRIAIARSTVMSCITACRPSRIESNPARRSRFSAAVRSVARTPAPLPR